MQQFKTKNRSWEIAKAKNLKKKTRHDHRKLRLFLKKKQYTSKQLVGFVEHIKLIMIRTKIDKSSNLLRIQCQKLMQ